MSREARIAERVVADVFPDVLRRGLRQRGVLGGFRIEPQSDGTFMVFYGGSRGSATFGSVEAVKQAVLTWLDTQERELQTGLRDIEIIRRSLFRL